MAVQAAAAAAEAPRGSVDAVHAEEALTNPDVKIVHGRIYTKKKIDAIVYPAVINLISNGRRRLATTRADVDGNYRFVMTDAEFVAKIHNKKGVAPLTLQLSAGIDTHADGDETLLCVQSNAGDDKPRVLTVADLTVGDVERNIVVNCRRTEKLHASKKRIALTTSDTDSDSDTDTVTDTDTSSSDFSDIFASTTSDFSSSSETDTSSSSDRDRSHHHRNAKTSLAGTAGSIVLALFLICCCVSFAVAVYKYPNILSNEEETPSQAMYRPEAAAAAVVPAKMSRHTETEFFSRLDI